jgi:hypothetical protein
MRFRLNAARPWLALLALCALFEAPALLLLDEPVRLTGELFALITAWFASRALPVRAGRPLRILLGAGTALLLLYRTDRIVFWLFMGEEPLLYDQLFMLRHLFVLFSDLWSWQVALSLVGVVIGIAAIVWVTRRLLREMAAWLEPGRRRELLGMLGALWLVLLAGSRFEVHDVPLVRWATPAVQTNLEQSHAIYQRVQQRIGRSPYRGYAALKLARRPDVYLVFVESYGRVMATHPRLRDGYKRQLDHLEQQLTATGWSMVSAYTRAPIMGGRSWLAEGSVLMGTHVGYEALFRHLIAEIDRVPNLVSFLAGQGYRTLMLAPADRVRRGIEKVNYYHYDKSIGFDDLDYHGPRFGWGLVPDQYSLNYVSTKMLSATPRPMYFEFHMVSSHAPWEQIPWLVSDWTTLGKKGEPPPSQSAMNATWLRLQRYVHTQRRFAYMGELRDEVAMRYARAEFYELGVLERYLPKLEGDALVIVLGDHQPPFLATETRSFSTPIHVLSRDPALLQEFEQHGFKSGLWVEPVPRETGQVRHEGLFSLIARTLVGCCGSGAPLPEYLPEGAQIGG